jgi:signal transduction histidine kinase/PAS domain-containing protein
MESTPQKTILFDSPFTVQELFEQTDLIVFVKDQDGIFTFMNKAGTLLLEQKLEEIIGKDEFELLGPTTAFEGWINEHKVLTLGKPQTARVTWKIHREERQLQITKHLLTDSNGELLGTLGIGQEIPLNEIINPTDQFQKDDLLRFNRTFWKSVEKIPKESQKLSQTLIALQSAMVAVAASLDLNHIIDTFTWEISQLLNVDNCILFNLDQEKKTFHLPDLTRSTKDYYKPKTHHLCDFPLINQAVTDRRSLKLDLEKIKPTFYEFDLFRSLGIKSVLILPMVIQDHLVEVAGLVELENEREFTDMEISMAQMLANQTASSILNARLYEALNEANQSLRASNEELDMFAHTVAHDLKGPIGIMKGFTDLLIIEGYQITEDERDKYLEIISKNGRKTNNIINGLLMLATVRKEDIQGEILDMEKFLNEAQFRVQQQFKDLQLQINVPKSIPPAWGNGQWVEEVWINYLSNAAKYGGRPPIVEVGASKQSNGMVCYWVKDNGKGISSEEQAHLFKPFSRLPNPNIEGHGLGLSIVRRIVEKLEGEVGVESEIGVGTKFSFTLPEASPNF